MMTGQSSTTPGAKRVKETWVPILMYHQVTPSPLPQFRKYAVTTEAFDRQLAWLAARGYAPVTMEALYRHRSGAEALPPRPVVLTFDDGYRDCLDYVAPILQARGFTATFFVVGKLAGKTSRWLLAERGIELPLLDWDAVRTLRAAGNECGSHAMSHTRLTRLSAKDCREELKSSRRKLEDELGEEVRHLAYPFGDYDESVRAIAGECGYATACSVRLGWSPPDDDLLALRRIHVHGEAELTDFADKFRRLRTPRQLIRAGARAIRRLLTGKP
jgi:peptidoglycan/xylan/chitin deacetylase (PgdA/CDA1 family)